MTWILTDFKGELAALSAALIWAIASLIYVLLGRQLLPTVLNFIKSGLAVGMILLTLLGRGDVSPNVGTVPLVLLALSGAIGIGLGDTAFFASLNRLGARQTLLIEALAPPLAAILAAIFLDEYLGYFAWFGIVLTVGGVTWVVLERLPRESKANPQNSSTTKFDPDSASLPSPPLSTAPVSPSLWQSLTQGGLGFGLFAAFAQASGAVLSRAALAETSVNPLWSTLIRLVGGLLVLLLLPELHQGLRSGLQALRSPRFSLILLSASFAGTYLGIWLQQTALKFAPAGIAQALTATSPLFILPFAVWTGDRITPRACLGVLIALGGIWLLFSPG
ncbi:MAG: DMT family transporter [Oculatellaceae cyanobacterium Prado106]|jgi:drug/metabolite transporter (DMT)-like permease|nr:DMT family transporter [Oculatellaceae cyanobacterium Prado106]